MKLLVKLGGTLLDAEAVRQSLAGQIAAASDAHQIVVVHGGGKQMTRFLAERGMESRFVNGLRVTTPEVLDAVVKVVAGSVNRELVAALNRTGVAAAGISGIDGCTVDAVQMDPALGSVGRVARANPALFHTLLAGGFLPVVACVAGDRSGNLYNVNADQMAVACAAAFAADQLIFLTDVDGVLDTGKQLIRTLTPAGCRELIAAGIATGGMQAKLSAAAGAIEQGVTEVRIAAGAAANVLARILAGEDAGTRLSAQEVISR